MTFFLRAAITFFAFIGIAAAATQAQFNAVEAKAEFCAVISKRLASGMGASDALQIPGVVKVLWQPARITFQTSESGPVVTEGVEYTMFDIDNDGRADLVVKYVTALRGKYGDILWISHASETVDSPAVLTFSREEFQRLRAVESTAPWPYLSRGLSLVEIIPFAFGGQHYLSIKDNLFGTRSFPERAWIIAKYAGKPFAIGGYGHQTDDFETICSWKRRDR